MGKLALISATVMAMSFASAAPAAEIKLLGSPGVRGLVEALAPKFQATTGHTIAGDFGSLRRSRTHRRRRRFDVQS